MNNRSFYKILVPLILITLVMNAWSCSDVLNQEPRDKISGDAVWGNQALVEAYVSDLYSRFPFFDYNITMMYHHDLATNRSEGGGGCRINGGMNASNDCQGYWNYELIRDLNIFLDEIGDAEISDGQKQQLEGEVRVIRAVVYFEKQKRYGGVPLVDVVLDPFGDIPEEYLVRSTEEQIADFIDSELELAASMLSPENTSATGRINQWTALAYKAQANLWAASIAKFGNVELNGLVGIPETRADEFYSKASAAARELIDSGRYTLFEENSNLADNYWQIFVEDANSEIIFERIYNGLEINHSFTHNTQPTELSSGQGSQLNPLLTHLQRFENLDGTFDNPPLGQDNLYPSVEDIWANKDPRLHGQVLMDGDVYGPRALEMHEGLDPTEGGTNPDNIISDWSEEYQGIPTAGRDGFAQESHFYTSTGFLLRKYVANTPLIERTTEDVNWKALRLGEMYLIVAEAEFEQGNLDEAATFLNYTRNRVGLPELDATTITRDRLRTERTSEMIFENTRWWDLRRWRIAQDRLDGQMAQGARIILHFETGEYYLLPRDAETTTRTFRPEHYYNPITVDRIEAQEQLVENPGY